MFPSALLVARARKDGVRPVFLGEAVLTQAEAVVGLYRSGVGQSRRELEQRVRELEAKVDKYKVVRGLALLVERRSTFSQRDGPDPPQVRRRLFDAQKGAAVTPEERDAVLAKLAPEFALTPALLSQYLWADLEEEQVLRSVPPLDASELLRKFNLGQCQTLLFKATQLELTFGTPEAYRLAVQRVKRKGLMFTAEAGKDGTAPVLHLEGTVSFLRSTERYGTRLAQLLPDLLSLPGWSLTAKVLYRDSSGRKRYLDFHLDHGMGEYLDIPAEEVSASSLPEVLEPVAASAERAGLSVDRAPPPLALGGGLEHPDLVLSRDGKAMYVEAVGYWSPEWVERKLKRTDSAPGPYVVVVSKAFAVAAGAEHPRLRAAGTKGLRLDDLKPFLPKAEVAREPPRRDLKAEDLVLPPALAFEVAGVARANRVPSAQALELLGALGFVCGGGFAVRAEALPRLRKEVAGALPELPRVEEVLSRHGLSGGVLPALGFKVRWKGLAGSVSAEG